jgi:hypothetical protein
MGPRWMAVTIGGHHIFQDRERKELDKLKSNPFRDTAGIMIRIASFKKDVLQNLIDTGN